MKIAVVHNLQLGGAWRRLANQVSRLGCSVDEVCLETAAPVTSAPTIVPLRRVSPRAPRALRPPTRYLDTIRLQAAWRRATELIQASGADVVFLNPCRFLQAPPIALAHTPPVVYFCDEPRRVDTEPDAAASRNPLTMPLYRPIYVRERRLDRLATSRAQLVATNSHYTAAEIERVYGRHAHVVRLGAPQPPPESLITRSSQAAGCEYLLSVGALLPAKGHELVLRAAAASALRPAVRIVAPREDTRWKLRLRGLARELGIALEIRVGIPDQQLSELYAGALATVYLARREPFGLVSLEAQAHGCPVIVADEGGLPETILDGETGWSCHREPIAAATRIDRLGDPRLRLTMSKAAREHAATWTWEGSAAQIRNLLAAAASSAVSSQAGDMARARA